MTFPSEYGTDLRRRSRRGIFLLKECAMQTYLFAETYENSRIYPSSEKNSPEILQLLAIYYVSLISIHLYPL